MHKKIAIITNDLYFCNPMSNNFQRMKSVRSNNQSLKYQRFTPSGFRDIGIRKLGFVAKTQLL